MDPIRVPHINESRRSPCGDGSVQNGLSRPTPNQKYREQLLSLLDVQDTNHSALQANRGIARNFSHPMRYHDLHRQFEGITICLFSLYFGHSLSLRITVNCNVQNVWYRNFIGFTPE